MPTAAPIAYKQFGQNLLDRVMTAQRVNDLFDEKFGGEIKVGRGLLRIKPQATRTVNRFEVLQDRLPELAFGVSITLHFKGEVEIGPSILGDLIPGDILDQEFTGRVTVETQAHIRALDPLTLFVDVSPLEDDSVLVDLDGSDLLTKIFDDAAEPKVEQEIIERVNGMLADKSPRLFDLAKLLDRAVDGG